MFTAEQAFAMTSGKGPSRRNAEIMLVNEVSRWRAEIEKFAENRLGEFDNLIRHALEYIAKPHRECVRAGRRPARYDPPGSLGEASDLICALKLVKAGPPLKDQLEASLAAADR